MNKKNKIIIFSLFILICISLSIIIFISKDNKSITNKSLSGLAFYVYDETTENYVTNDTIPTGSYALNETLSYCKGNGEIGEYDSKNGTISFEFTSGDSCYLYFDKVEESLTLTLVGVDNYYLGWDNSYNSCFSEFSINGVSTTIYSSESSLSISSPFVINTTSTLSLARACTIYFCETSTCNRNSYDSFVGYSDTANSAVSSLTLDSNIHYYYLYEACFTKETYVWIYDEKKKKKRKIKVINLKKGMTLVHVDTKTGKVSYDKVSDIEVHTTKEVYAIHVAGEVIRCSGGHTFYISENTVLMAKELQAGMKLLASDGKSYLIDKIEKETYSEGIELYTIITEKKNNYLVTTLKILSYVMVGYTLTVASFDIGYSRTDPTSPGQTEPTEPSGY